MCGLIAAFARDDSVVLDEQALGCALRRMRNRGPDSEGRWSERGAVLGHRRLAILDLDERAAQPLVSVCGRYVIALNGEIYNFRELRGELERKGAFLRTTSDTEVVLELFAREGEAMLPKLAGMFAFVIWDRLARKAFAARDPYGIKPMYLAHSTRGVLLASQVKALLATNVVSRELCARGQAGYWMLGSVPEPYTWYRDIKAVPAGAALWIQDGGVRKQWRWKDIGDAWRSADDMPPPAGDIHEAVREALRESVRRHLVADVPVGVFLSGGIDSGALAALMIEQGAKDLVGVTVAYDEFAGRPEDETPPAAELARYYGIRHVVRKVSREEFNADLPRILDAMDQPSIDGVNTWYAAKAVAEHGLKVVVSGVGGDELFQGYRHFRSLPRILKWRNRLNRLPGVDSALRMLGILQARRTGKHRWDHLQEWTGGLESLWWLYRSIRAPEELPRLIPADLAATPPQCFDAESYVRAMTGMLSKDPRLAIGQIESLTYLRNQLLRDSDWASMDHSVELRTPLVDSRLLETLAPWLRTFSRYPRKQLLARAPVRRLPIAVTQRTKTGFGIPVAKWYSGRNLGLDVTWAPAVAHLFDGAD